MKRQLPWILAVGFLFIAFHADATEDPFTVYVDDETGCHYLVSEHYAIPRTWRNQHGVIEQVCGGQMMVDTFMKMNKMLKPKPKSIIMELNEQ